MTLTTAQTTINERSSFRYSGKIVDEAGNPIPGSELSTLTLTLFNAADKAIINSRDDQTALNANGVTLNESGDLQWSAESADNPIVGDVGLGLTEKHLAQFEWTWGSGKRGSHILTLHVVQLHEVP